MRIGVRRGTALTGLLMALSFVLASGTGVRAQTMDEGEFRRAVLTLMVQFEKAVAVGDSRAMDQIMAPDFTFVALDKSVFGRKAFEEAVREARKTFDTSSVKLKLEKVRIEGSKGIATLTATTDAAFKDSKKKTHTLLTVEVVEMTHVKDGGIWKVTSGKSLNFSQKIDGKRTH